MKTFEEFANQCRCSSPVADTCLITGLCKEEICPLWPLHQRTNALEGSVDALEDIIFARCQND